MTVDVQWGVIPPDTKASRLRRAREYAGLNQTEMANALGVSPKTVSRYEDGSETRRSVVMAWSMATGVNLQWLETGEAPRPDGPKRLVGLPQLDSNQQPSDYRQRLATGRALRVAA